LERVLIASGYCPDRGRQLSRICRQTSGRHGEDTTKLEDMLHGRRVTVRDEGRAGDVNAPAGSGGSGGCVEAREGERAGPTHLTHPTHLTYPTCNDNLPAACIVIYS